MTISKLTIRSFGVLVEREFELTSKVNVIYGANESGKTSLASFIKFMLYGLDAKKGSPTEKERFVNRQTGRAEGAMEFSHEGHSYRIERSVGESSRETKKLIDLETLTPVKFEGEIGEYLFGVSESVFLNTSFIRQWAGSSVDTNEVRLAVANILSSADEKISVDRITKKLDAARVKLRHKNSTGGRLRELERDIANAEAEMDRAKHAHASSINAKNDLEDKQRTIARLRSEITRLTLTLKLYEDVKDISRRDELRASLSEMTELEGRLASMKAPDGTVRNEVAALKARLASASEALQSAERDLDKLDGEIAKSRSTSSERDAMREKQRDADRKKAHALSKKTSRSLVLTMVSIPFFVIFAALGAAALAVPTLFGGLFTHNPVVWYLIGVLGVLGLVRTAVELILRRTAKKKLANMLALRGVGDVDSFEAALDDEARFDYEMTNRRNERAVIADRLESAKREYEDAKNASAELVSKLGADATSPNALDDIERTLAEAEAEYARVKGLLDAKRGECTAMGKALNEVNFGEIELRLRENEGSSELRAAKEMDEAAKDKAKLNLKLNTEKLRAIEMQCEELKKSAYSSAGSSPAEIGEAIAEMKREYERGTLRLEAIELSAALLDECSEQLRSALIPGIVERASEAFRAASAGRHGRMAIGDDFTIRCDGADGVFPIDMLSAGGADAAYICLRRALTPALYRREAPPAIYDESFGAIDEERTLRLVSLVAADDAQSLIFTCRASDAKMICAELSPSANALEL